MAKTKKTNLSTPLLIETMIAAMQDKKAEKIIRMDLSEIPGTLFDYFIICHGNSTTHVDAIAEEVRQRVKTECQIVPVHAEGFANSEWILLDYHGVLVHVFLEEVREHFQLENLWADAICQLIVEEEPIKKSIPKNESRATVQPRATASPRATAKPRATASPRATAKPRASAKSKESTTTSTRKPATRKAAEKK